MSSAHLTPHTIPLSLVQPMLAYTQRQGTQYLTEAACPIVDGLTVRRVPLSTELNIVTSFHSEAGYTQIGKTIEECPADLAPWSNLLASEWRSDGVGLQRAALTLSISSLGTGPLLPASAALLRIWSRKLGQAGPEGPGAGGGHPWAGGGPVPASSSASL